MKNQNKSFYFVTIIIILSLIVLLFLRYFISPHSSGPSVFNIINDTETPYPVNFVLIDIYKQNNYENIVQEDSVLLSPNVETTVKFNDYEAEEKSYLFIQLLEGDEVKYTFSTNELTGKGTLLHIIDNPLRIDIENFYKKNSL